MTRRRMCTAAQAAALISLVTAVGACRVPVTASPPVTGDQTTGAVTTAAPEPVPTSAPVPTSNMPTSNAPPSNAPTSSAPPSVPSATTTTPSASAPGTAPAAAAPGATPLAVLPATALLVGPGHPYATPCQAITAAQPGDTIGIDALGNGGYDGDVCAWSTDGLTVMGFNGRAHIDAAGQNSQGKATWVISGDATHIQDIELSGAAVPDRNGAGIRQEGAGLTVVRSYFHDNENGILAGDNPDSDIIVDSTEFARNGAGDGQSHNFYINRVRSFTLQYSWSHDANAGHLAKSRALTNRIQYNRLTGEAGSNSYELDLPSGGRSYVIGNVIQQGSGSQNSNLVTFGVEGSLNPESRLLMINNTLVNDQGRGNALLVGGDVSTPVVVRNNISVGNTALVQQSGAVVTANCEVADPLFVDRQGFDYRLQVNSPCVGTATPVGLVDGVDLTPTSEYQHVTTSRLRAPSSLTDAGAFGIS